MLRLCRFDSRPAVCVCVWRVTMRLCYLFSLILLFGMLGLIFLIHVQDLMEMVNQEAPDSRAQLKPRESRKHWCGWSLETTSTPPPVTVTSDPTLGLSAGHQDPSQWWESPPLDWSQPWARWRGAAELPAPRRHRRRLQVPGFRLGSRQREAAERLRLREVQQGRRRRVAETCLSYREAGGPRLLAPHHVSRIYVEDRYRLLYCEVPKAGCSNWKRVLMVLGGWARSTAQIQHMAAHYGNSLRRLDSFDREGMWLRLRTYTKLLFVREPLERLVSAFRDKFEQPNAYYHPVFGTAIIARYRHNATREALSTGSGVTFPEFVQYLLDSSRPVGMDIHWEPVSRLCSPCLLHYDFIGHFESLETEADSILHLIGAPRNLTYPRFKDRHSQEERTSPRISHRYLAQLSPADRHRVFHFYQSDYTMFNYRRPEAIID